MRLTSYAVAVDMLGHLNAQIADLSAQAEFLKKELKAAGEGAYEGALFRATVSMSERETLDMKAVREKLTPQFIRAHTNVTQVVTVRVAGKKDGVLAQPAALTTAANAA